MLRNKLDMWDKGLKMFIEKLEDESRELITGQ